MATTIGSVVAVPNVKGRCIGGEEEKRREGRRGEKSRVQAKFINLHARDGQLEDSRVFTSGVFTECVATV